MEKFSIVEMPFFNFQQVPNCQYDYWYTITYLEKDYDPNTGEPDMDQQIEFDEELEDVSISNPEFITIDLWNRKLVLDASSELLIDRAFQVNIKYHVAVNSTI